MYKCMYIYTHTYTLVIKFFKVTVIIMLSLMKAERLDNK